MPWNWIGAQSNIPKTCHILLGRSKFQVCLHSRESIKHGFGAWGGCVGILLIITHNNIYSILLQMFLQSFHHCLLEVHLLRVSSRIIRKAFFEPMNTWQCWFVTFVCNNLYAHRIIGLYFLFLRDLQALLQSFQNLLLMLKTLRSAYCFVFIGKMILYFTVIWFFLLYCHFYCTLLSSGFLISFEIN